MTAPTRSLTEDPAELHYQLFRLERLTLWLNRLAELEPICGGWLCCLCAGPTGRLSLEKALVHLRVHRPSWFSAEIDRD